MLGQFIKRSLLFFVFFLWGYANLMATAGSVGPNVSDHILGQIKSTPAFGWVGGRSRTRHGCGQSLSISGVRASKDEEVEIEAEFTPSLITIASSTYFYFSVSPYIKRTYHAIPCFHLQQSRILYLLLRVFRIWEIPDSRAGHLETRLLPFH